MRYLLAVDPGVKALGWAWFYNDKLVTCGLVRAKDLNAMVVGNFPWNMPDLAIVERPTVYRRGGKGDANDLISVALAAGAAAARSRAAEFVEPRAWKGSVPKNVHNDRITAALSFGECSIVDDADAPASLYHNVLDAVGIGLWKLGRM